MTEWTITLAGLLLSLAILIPGLLQFWATMHPLERALIIVVVMVVIVLVIVTGWEMATWPPS